MKKVKTLVGLLTQRATLLKAQLGKTRAEQDLAGDYAKAMAVGFGLLNSDNQAHRDLAKAYVDEYDEWIARTSHGLQSNTRIGIKALLRTTADQATA